MPTIRSMAVSLVSANLQLYPARTIPAYVKAGVGFARVELSHGADEIRSTGPGVLLGVGYDILLKNSFAATPFVHAMQLLVGSKSGMLDGVADSSPANPRVLHLGVALTELAAAGVSPASGGARWLE